VEKLKAEGPTLVVDSGNLLWKSSVISESERSQIERKAKLIAESYALMGVDAMAPAEGDLSLGLDQVRALSTTYKLPYLASNLECGPQNYPFDRYKVVESGGIKIGIIGIVGNSIKVDGCLATDPVAAAQAAFDQAGTVDIRLVLSNERTAEDQRLAEMVPGIDFIINGADRRELSSPEALTGGGLLFAPGSRGKKLGVFKFDPTGSGHSWRDAGAIGELAARRDTFKERLEETRSKAAQSQDEKEKARLETRVRYLERELNTMEEKLKNLSDATSSRSITNRLEEMSETIINHPATQALVEAAKKEIEAMMTAITPAKVDHGPFAGSAACTGCHAPEAAHWSQTAHAHAWQSLVAKTRQLDAACYSCHVTGAFHVDGPKSPLQIPGLENVGCESCHGPGKEHAANPSMVELVRKPEKLVCTECHDGKQDEGRFEEAAYWARITHPTSSISP
jgi:2',3'-cyclic-nucleotide 2'-phosphodiesterase (5'-nucleotidase family)